MTMFRFPLMKQVFSGMFSKKEKKNNRKERHLVMDALESRELLTVTAASTTSFYVNELPIYETSSDIIEQIQNLRDNNLSVDYDLGGDEDGDLVVTWERPDVIYTNKGSLTTQFEPVIDGTTLSPALDWNIYARYLTNETQRLYLDYDAYNTGTYSNISLFYGQMQNLDPDGTVEDTTVDTKIATGLVYKISFTSEAQPLSPNQDSINARFSIYAYDNSGQSTVSTFTFNEEYVKTLSIDAETDEDVLNYTYSMETNAAELQAKLRGLGQQQGKYLNDCVVKAVSPTEFYVYVYSQDVQATWDGSKWVYDGVPNLAIYQENPEGNDASGFEVSAEISIVSAPCLYNNIKVDPTKPLDTADNIQRAFDAKKNTNLMAPIFMPAPDRINAQRRDILEGPATESDLLVSGGVYPDVLVVPVFGLTDDAGNSLDGYVYDITFVGNSSYINHPLLTALSDKGTTSLSDDPILSVETIKESSPEFRVNSLEESDPAGSTDPFKEVTYYNQLNPAVAMDADGDFVITWQSEVSNVLVRGSYTDIYAKTYSARSYINDHSYLNDAYVTEETDKKWPSDMMVNKVDTYTYIEVDPNKLKENYYQKDSKTVYIQSVVETSKEFRVNTSTTNAQRNPDVAMDLDGNFVIVWDSEGQTISYFNGVYMQRYSKNAKPLSSETRVDTEVTGASTNPSVAADDNGRFIVAWEYTNNPLMDIQFPYYTFYNHYFNYYYETDFYYMSEIHASVYNTIYPSEDSFTQVEKEFIVGGTDVNGGKDPQVAWSDTDDVIISWTGLETDTDSTGEFSSGVYAEQYKSHTYYAYRQVSATAYFNNDELTAEQAIKKAYREFQTGTNGLSYTNYKTLWQQYEGDVMAWLQEDPNAPSHLSLLVVPDPEDDYMRNLWEKRSTINDNELRITYDWWREQVKKLGDGLGSEAGGGNNTLTCEYYIKASLDTNVTKVRNTYRINSATFNLEDNPTYWDYSQIVGDVGLDADGDVIATYAGYGPDISVNSIIPYINGASMSTTGSWTLFLDNMKTLLRTQSDILKTRYGDEEFADLTNFFNPTGRSTGKTSGDYFETITKDRVDEDGTLVTFTSNKMLRLLDSYDKLIAVLPEEITPTYKETFEREFYRIFGYHVEYEDFDVDLNVIKNRAEFQKEQNYYLTGKYECHGDVNSVISMVLTNTQLLLEYDPQYIQLRKNDVEFQNVQKVVLGALASVLDSQFGLLRGESSGVMFTQIDAAVESLDETDTPEPPVDGEPQPAPTNYAESAIIHSDSVVNSKRDGVTAVADVALDVMYNRIWDSISLTIVNKANQVTEAVAIDLNALDAYEDVGNGLYRLNRAIAAEAIEQAISEAVNVVGTSWRDETNQELDKYEGPVEVRVIDWNELQARGLMHVDNETTRYSNASMDMEMFRTWYNDNREIIERELGVDRFSRFTFNDLLDFINNENLTEREREARIDSLPIIFEIVFQGSVHDLEVSMTWENGTVRLAEQQLLTLSPNPDNPNQALWYAIQVNGEPDAFENPGQLLTFICANEATVNASLANLQGYIENLGYQSVEVELVGGPRDEDGNYKYGPVGPDDDPYEIRITFAGNVGENITIRYFNTFVLPPLTEQGGYDPSNFPWLSDGYIETLHNGGTYNREEFGVSMYYYGDLGTPQTDATINVTPEGDFQVGYLQHELYNSRYMSTKNASSIYNSYSNTNVMVRAFDEATDTAGPKVSGLCIDNHRVQQSEEINTKDINYIIVYFNEEMMYYNQTTKYKNSESADWDNSVINPENWQLAKDGSVQLGKINNIYYGMNMSQYLYDENGDPLSEYGSNKWEAVIFLNDADLDIGSYELIVSKRIEDVKGNRLNKNGENPDGSDTVFKFNIQNNHADPPISTGEKNYFEENIGGISDYRWSPDSVGINDNGDTVTVWITENDGRENICMLIEYANGQEHKEMVHPLDDDNNVTLTLFDDNGVAMDNSEFGHNIQHAAVAMGEDGDFIVTWSEYNIDNSTHQVTWDVYARRYYLNGTPKDDMPIMLSYDDSHETNDHENLRVNATTLGDQMYSSVAISALGNYAVTWMSLFYQNENEKSNADWDIYMSQFYADGTLRIDDVATQEIIFSSTIQEGTFRIDYASKMSQYLDNADTRSTSPITFTPPQDGKTYGTISYNGVEYRNTPEQLALVLKRALQEIGIDATVETTSQELFTVKFNSLDGAPVPANMGELAIVPSGVLKAPQGDVVNVAVRTKFAADAGEKLVNENYLLTAGAKEVQDFCFGVYGYFSNLNSMYFEFDYTDFNGVTHYCRTTKAYVLTRQAKQLQTITPDPTLEDIRRIREALSTFVDQNGESITTVTLVDYDGENNIITVDFSDKLLGYDISPLRAVKVQVDDPSIAEHLDSTEKVKGTMGGIVANPTSAEIARNRENYYELQDKQHQMFPDIAMDAAGNIVVTWTSYGDSKYGDGSTDANIYARRYDVDGDTVSIGLVNAGNLEGVQKWSSVDFDRKGDYVITWTSDNQDGIEIYARRYTFLQAYYNGDAPASVLDPDRDKPNSYYTEVLYCNEYGYLIDYKGQPIFFHSEDNAEKTTENYLDLEYKAVGDAFIVNTTQLGKQEYSKVSMDADGNFIVVWESDDKNNYDSEKEYQIFAQKFVNILSLSSTSDIGKDGNEFLIDHATYDDHSDRFPSVAMNSEGDWIIGWTCFTADGQITDDNSVIYHVVYREEPFDDDVSPMITKFQVVSPVEQGDLFTYLLDDNNERVTDKLGNPVFTWTDREQRYAVNDNNEIYTVDEQGNITSPYETDDAGHVVSVEPLNNPDNPTYVYDDYNKDLDIYQPGEPTVTKDVTVSDELPYSDFTSNGLLNYIFSRDDDTGAKEYVYTDAKDSYLDLDNGKIYNSDEYKTQDMDYLISEDYSLDENGEQVVALIVGFSEEMSHSGSSSVLNPSNWKIYRTEMDGTKVLVPIEDIVDREDSMFADGNDNKNEIVIFIRPGEDGLPALESGYTYEFIGSTDMEDLNKNPLDGSYSQWDYGKNNGKVGGTESTNFEMEIDAGIPSTPGSGNVSKDPEDFVAADLQYDTLVNFNKTEGVQENSAVAMDQYGNYIVVWETDWIDDNRTSSHQENELPRYLYKDGKLVAQSIESQTNGFRYIMAKMYDYDGNEVCPEFVVYKEEYVHQSQPDVAMDKYGNIVITWVELSDTRDSHVEDSNNGIKEKVILDPYDDGTNIFALRYKLTYDNDHYATSLDQYGNVFQVDNDVKGVKTDPKVAIDSTTGNFVIVWANEDYSTYPEYILSNDNYYPDGSVDRCGIYARLYRFADTDVYRYASVGSYSMTVSDNAKELNTLHTYLPAIEAMQTTDGSYTDKPFLVNNADNVSQATPSVAMENGKMVVVWQSGYTKSAIEGRAFELNEAGQITRENRFDQVRISVNANGDNGDYNGDNQYNDYKDKNGNIVASKFNNYTPSVDMDSEGNAVIAYASKLHVISGSKDLTDNSEKGIYARTFPVDSNGRQRLYELSPEFRVNTTTYDDQCEPVVGLGDDGRCVISWISFGQEVSDYDASETSRYSLGVFAKWYDDVFSAKDVANKLKAGDTQINSLTYGSQFQQDISVNDDGQCVFTWTGPGDLLKNYPSDNIDEASQPTTTTQDQGAQAPDGADTSTDTSTDNGNSNSGSSGNKNDDERNNADITNTHDNLVNGSYMAGVSNTVSTLDYSDIYRRRFLWTSPTPSSLSPDYTNDEGIGSVRQNEEVGSGVKNTSIFSVSDGTWTLAQDNSDMQQINSKILDVDGNGSDITVYGSVGADNVRIRTVERTNADGQKEKVDVLEMTNSLGQKLTLSNFGNVNVVGRGGEDSIVFENDKPNESRTFTASGNSAAVTNSAKSYTYSVFDFSNINFKGAEGDAVKVSGTNEADDVTLDDNSVSVTGADYAVTADGFSTLTLDFEDGIEGNSDTLTINAKTIEPGTFSIDSEGGLFSIDKDGYDCEFSGFDTVTATPKSSSGAQSGSTDAIVNVTSSDAELEMYSNKVKLSENGKTIVLNNFSNVTANIEPDAEYCTVRIYDSTGNDSYLFDAKSKTATMSLSNGNKLKAVGTTNVESFSKYGGTDTATFNDSSSVDSVKMAARSMIMTDGDVDDPSAVNSYYVTANGFAINNANSTDNQDAVQFVDSTAQGAIANIDYKDDFTVTCLDNKVMAFMQSSARTTYNNTAIGFKNIVATSHSTAAVDTARVSDGLGDLAATTFDVSPNKINMVLANGTTVEVNGFRNKVVESTTAINLTDGLSDDTLVIQENKASMSGEFILLGANTVQYSITAQAPVLTATSENGGADKATIICSADKNEAIDVKHVGESVTVNVADVNGTFSNTVKDFKTTNVNKADNNDSAEVKISNSVIDTPITVQSYINKFTYSQNGSYSREVAISGALKSLNFTSENNGKLNVSLHDSAMADLLDVKTSSQTAVIEQVATNQTRSFKVTGNDMITVSGDSSMDTKKVDDVLTNWDDWSDTDTWLKGE